VKYALFIALVALGIGYLLYRYLPFWVFGLFVLVNFLGWAVARGGASRGEEE
jgi:branched-subunit amino acid transport protein AzlD